MTSAVPARLPAGGLAASGHQLMKSAVPARLPTGVSTAQPSAASGGRSPARRVWIESSFVSGGKGDQLPANFGNVNDDDGTDDFTDDLDDDELIIGEANYSDGQIR
jgi:hypothetical protein